MNFKGKVIKDSQPPCRLQRFEELPTSLQYTGELFESNIHFVRDNDDTIDMLVYTFDLDEMTG